MERSSYPSNLSYWEIKQYLQDIDLVVIGSGIVGLTTAIFYKKNHPNSRVLVVEKGPLPSGASTKNAGFACFGSPSEILSDLKHASEEEVFDTVTLRIDGLNALRQLLGDDRIHYNSCGGFEVFGPDDEDLYTKCLDFIPQANKELVSTSGLKDTYIGADEQIVEFGLSGVSHLILNQYEGSIDTGMMMNSLLRMASELGIKILNGMELLEFTELSLGVDLSFANGISFTCKKIHIATNGFAKRLVPDLDVNPARAQVLITSEIENLRLNGTFHMNEGFYYFRNVGKRVLLGGGRELDLDGETTTDLKTTELIQNRLDEILQTVILSGCNFKVEHRWAGIMGVGQQKQTTLRQLSESVSCSVRLGGMGVAIGTSIGKQSAEMIG